MLAAGRHADFRAGISFAGPSITWPDAPALQEVLLAAMASTEVPLFLIQAWDDFSLTPTYVLGAALARHGKPHEARVYGRIGTEAGDGTVCSTRSSTGGCPTSCASLAAGSTDGLRHPKSRPSLDGRSVRDAGSPTVRATAVPGLMTAPGRPRNANRPGRCTCPVPPAGWRHRRLGSRCCRWGLVIAVLGTVAPATEPPGGCDGYWTVHRVEDRRHRLRRAGRGARVLARLVRRQPDDLVGRLRLPGRRRHPHLAGSSSARACRSSGRGPRPSPPPPSPPSTGWRPGRTFLGIGNGHTAWRIMGQKPVTMAEFEEYVRVVRALLDGEETEYTVSRPDRPRSSSRWPHMGYLDLEHHIPIYVSSFGPKGAGDGRPSTATASSPPWPHDPPPCSPCGRTWCAAPIEVGRSHRP